MIDVTTLQPGDLFILPDGDGCWELVLTYEGPDPSDPNRIAGQTVDGQKRYAVRLNAIVLPSVVWDTDDHPSSPAPGEALSALDTEETSSTGKGRARKRKADRAGDSPITAEQRRMLFAVGRSRGLDIDDLRAFTPAGSISALTRSQAGQLIDRLTGRTGSQRGAQGTATSKQLGLIGHLADQLRMDESALNAWLKRQYRLDSLDDIRDGDLASRVIGGLMEMQRNRKQPTRTGSGTGRSAG